MAPQITLPETPKLSQKGLHVQEDCCQPPSSRATSSTDCPPSSGSPSSKRSRGSLCSPSSSSFEEIRDTSAPTGGQIYPRIGRPRQEWATEVLKAGAAKLGSRASFEAALATAGANLKEEVKTIGRPRQEWTKSKSRASFEAALATAGATLKEEAKTRNALRNLRSFKFFQDFEPNVQQKLASIVQHTTYKQGTVIFRQRDPPGSCYIILSGEIGIFVKSDDDTSQLASTSLASSLPTGSEVSDKEKPSDGDLKNKRFARRSSSLGDLLLSDMAAGLATAAEEPMLTAEGFSSYTEVDDLGPQVTSWGPGKLFGELALLNNMPRTATIKCCQESEFLVISRSDFDSVIKAEMARAQLEKLNFLKLHLPGVRELPVESGSKKPHASYFFRKSSYGRGHAFLTQGAREEEGIYVLVSGAVEFQRREASNSRPGTPTQKVRPGSAASIGVQSGRYRKGSLPTNRRSDGCMKENLPPGDNVKRMGILLPGGVFGTLSFVSSEPFTVTVVSAPCDVFFVSGADVRKLSSKLVDTIRDYLVRAMQWRLERLRSVRSLEFPAMVSDLPAITADVEAKHASLCKAGTFHGLPPSQHKLMPLRPWSSPGASRNAAGSPLATGLVEVNCSSLSRSMPNLHGC